MSNSKQDTAIANEPREEIDADLAVGMVIAGFHVYMDGANEPLNPGIFAKPDFNFDVPHTYAASITEVEQYGALEALCEKLDSLNDNIRADTGASLEEYADELLYNDESMFIWTNGFSEWENIRASILMGETEYLHNFLNDYAYGSELVEDLEHYETTYLKGKSAALREPLIVVSSQSGTNNVFDATSVGFEREKRYTVAEFNHALKKANEKWQEDGTVTRDYEYDHEPNREKVMSDHADKLAEEAIDRHEAEYGADGYRAFPNHETKAEHILQQQDISHNTNNAALSAAKTANGQKGSNIMSTKMECTSMILSEGNTNSKTKAVASITVNDEFVIKGIKMYESSAGNLDIVMPSRKFGNEYQDVVFPITAEAREQMKQAVLETYTDLVESGLDKLPLEVKDAPEKSTSKVTVSINLCHSTDEAKSNVKAVGQIVIDDCIVVSGVTVKHYTKDGVEADFVSMPSYKKMDDFGETTYSEYAHAITKECHAKISNAVLGVYKTLQRTEYKGVKLSELGEKADVSTKYGMNSNFAEKLMSQLEKNGIAYSAKVSGTTAISVRNTDKAAVDKIEKDLSAALKKEAQKAEQKPDQKINAPKKGKAH